MTVRMLYLTFVRLMGWMALLARSAASTVRQVLKRLGIPPAPQRDRATWRQFLHSQAATMPPCDFFHVAGERATRFKFLVRDRARNLRPPDVGNTATAPVTDLATARIRHRNVPGRLIHEYERAA